MSFAVAYNNGVKDVKDWYGGTTKTQSGTITAADGYNIVQIKKAYYGNNDVTNKFRFTKVTDQKYNYTFSLSQRDLDNLLQISDFSVHLDVVTEKIGAIIPKTDLKVSYNNGETDVTDIFKDQRAGNVSGVAKAAPGYIITGIRGARYSLSGGFVNVDLDNFKEKNLTDYTWSYSFDITNDNIDDINKNNLTVDLLVDTDVDPSTVTDDTPPKAEPTPATPPKTEPTPATPPKVDPSIDLQVSYNNGVTTVIDTIKGQKAGTVKGKVKAATGYTITGVIGANYNIYQMAGFQINLDNFNATKISDYEYSYSFDLTDKNIDDISKYGTPVTIDVDTQKIHGNINVDNSKLVNCTISPATITQNKETVLTLNADNGYILNGTGSYTVDGTTNSFTCNNISSYQITVTANTSISISFTATKTVDTKSSSYVHTYVLTQDDYNILGKQLLIGINSSGTDYDQYDYTGFINYLYEIPFQVGTDMTTSTNTINLGKENAKINCRTVTRETLDIDLGSIDLTSVSSSHDYNPINTTLYCPFSNNIVLPPTVLGSKLYLSFSINLKTEQALLLVKQNDNIIYSGQTEMFTDLPLYYSAGIQDTVVRKLKTQYQNTIKQAYIVINYHKPITDLTSYKTTEHGVLANYKGFTRVSHGTLKKSINNSIDNSLLNLLRQGIIIK